MAELKTKKNEASVDDFLNSISDEQMRNDCLTITKLMQQATKSKPKMWGTAIVGFGDYRYKYESGREGDWFVMGFSPRKQALSLYLMNGLSANKDLLEKLGKHKTGKGCLYIKRLSDVDHDVLKALMNRTVESCKAK